MTFRFGPFDLDPATPVLRRDGRRVRLTRQPLDLLCLLVENAGEVVHRTTIQERLWGHPYVEADLGINQSIRKVRAALGDDPRRAIYVETLPGRGYRFVAPVVPVPGTGAVGGRDPAEVRVQDPAAVRGRDPAQVRVPDGAEVCARDTTSGIARPVAATVSAALVGVLAVAVWAGGVRESDARTGLQAPEPAAAGDPTTSADIEIARAAALADRWSLSLLEQAVRDLTAVARARPEAAEPRLALAIASSRRAWSGGGPAAARIARVELRAAERLGAPEERLAFARGVLAFHDRDYEAALEAFARAREGGDRSFEADVELMTGKALRRMGRWEEAEASFARAYAANPTSFQTTYALASTARFRGHHRRAARLLSLLRDLDSGHWIPWAIAPVDAVREGGDVERARRLAEESAAALGSGHLYAMSQMLSRVLSAEIVAQPPVFEGPRLQLGGYHLSLGEAYRIRNLPGPARAHFDSAVVVLQGQILAGRWPDSHLGYPVALLASAEAGRGNAERAVELANAALAQVPFERDAVAGAMVAHQAAQALAVAGRIDQAARLVETLLTRPSTLTPALLRVDPVWAEVRRHPRVGARLRGST